MRLKAEWREVASNYVSQCWHVPEFRYLDIATAPRVRVAEIAAMAYRSQLNYAAGQVKDHPRSRKAADDLRTLTRELVRVGRYLLEAQNGQ